MSNNITRDVQSVSDEQKDPLRLSRSEIESVCTTAARGAGMSWGLAEEAGFAAGWMASCGLDGAGLLARQLHHVHEYCWPDLSPVVNQGEWCASDPDQALCPIAVGATLNDYLSVDRTLLNDAGLHVSMVSFPGLLLPFIALGANELNTFVHVHTRDGIICMSADGSLSGDVSVLMAAEQEALVIVTGEVAFERTVPLQEKKRNSASSATGETQVTGLSPMILSTWPFLYGLSMRTRVPASEASRANAGAAGSDND